MTQDGIVEREHALYDQHWEHAQVTEAERGRIASTVASIPRDCRRVLDVGCGDGRVSHEIKKTLECFLVAFDISTAGLRRISVPRCCGSTGELPFPDRSFDAVIATEMLEHLPASLYPQALTELTRVADKYILITVPNCENLEEHIAVCPACGSRFHAWGHMRSYTPGILKKLFIGFRAARVFPIGEPFVVYNRFLLYFRTRVAGGCHWDNQTTCYSCHSTRRPLPRWPFLVRVCDALNLRVSAHFSKRPGWLLALYAREET